MKIVSPAMDLVFILAWAFPLVVVLLYRLWRVPRRLDEMEDVFIGPTENGPIANLRVTPACQYVTLFRSLRYNDKWTRNTLMGMFREHFYGWHSWSRYVIPLAAIFVISAVEWRFVRDWTNVKLLQSSVALPETSLTAPKGSGGDSAKTLTAKVAGRDSVKAKPLSLPSWFRSPSPEQLNGVKETIVLALLGALIWSIFEVITRCYSRDLTPQELLEITFRLIAAVPIGYAFAQLAENQWNAPLAFMASAFPTREVQRLMRERVLAKASEKPGSENLPTAHLGQVIEGISNVTAARLTELNITTAWDLAYVDPVALMARTGYSLRVILTWMDQALLIVYFNGRKAILANLAIPCALDLCEFYERHCQDPANKKEILKTSADDPAVKDLALKLDIPPSILPERLKSLYEDPHVCFLRATWYGETA